MQAFGTASPVGSKVMVKLHLYKLGHMNTFILLTVLLGWPEILCFNQHLAKVLSAHAGICRSAVYASSRIPLDSSFSVYVALHCAVQCVNIRRDHSVSSCA